MVDFQLTKAVVVGVAATGPAVIEGCGPTFGFSNGLQVDRAWGEPRMWET